MERPNLLMGVADSREPDITALHLRVEDTRLALVSLPMQYLTFADVQAARSFLGAECGIEADCVMVVLSDVGDVRRCAERIPIPGDVLKKAGELLKEAMRSERPAVCGAESVRVPRLFDAYRMVTRNLRVVSSFMTLPPGEMIGPESEAFDAVQTVLFRDGDGRPLAALWFQHAVPEERGEGSFAAAVRKAFHEIGGPDVPMILVPGACGNQRLALPFDEAARRMADALLASISVTSCPVTTSLSFATRRVALGRRDASIDYEIHDLRKRDPELFEALRAWRERLQDDGEHAMEASVSAVAINECTILCFPGALFGEVAAQLASEDGLCACGVNQNIGLLPTLRAMTGGGYETYLSPWCMAPAGTAERLMAIALDLREEVRP